MTASTDQRAEENKAAALFILALGFLAGGAGVLVAALSVGLQRAWSGMEPRGYGEGWRRRVADHRAWLDMDRRTRDEWRAKRQAWWRNGADPQTRPAQDPAGKRLGAWARRTWARTAVGTDRTGGALGRFWRGAREGWMAADEVRRNGGKFGEVAKARPVAPAVPVTDADRDDTPAPTGARAEYDRLYAEFRNAWNDQDWAGVIAALDETKRRYPTLYEIRACDLVDSTTGEPRGDVPVPLSTMHEKARQNLIAEPAIDNRTGDEHQGAVDGTQETSTEETMTIAPERTTRATTPAASAAPAGETNLDLTDADLSNINTTLNQITEHVDVLAQLRSVLIGQLAAAGERATANGGTSQTIQALDAGRAVSDQISDYIGRLSESSVEASDQTSAAQAGLAPARDAQDALWAAGARGEFVATAHSD